MKVTGCNLSSNLSLARFSAWSFSPFPAFEAGSTYILFCLPLQGSLRRFSHGSAWLQGVMPDRFPSRAWSCGDVVAGATAVVEQMEGAATDLEVVNYKRDFLSETRDMQVDELEKLLKESCCEIMANRPSSNVNVQFIPVAKWILTSVKVGQVGLIHF